MVSHVEAVTGVVVDVYAGDTIYVTDSSRKGGEARDFHCVPLAEWNAEKPLPEKLYIHNSDRDRLNRRAPYLWTPSEAN